MQKAIELVFYKVLELGSSRQGVLWFLEHNLELAVKAWVARRPGGAASWLANWIHRRYGLFRKPRHSLRLCGTAV